MMIFGIPTLLIAVGAVLLASTAIGTIALHTELHTGLVVLTILQGIIFAGAVFYVWQWRDKGHLSSRRTLLFILGVAVLLRALPLFSLPHSTDIYRYIWDGRVQADGINPYRYIPADPALEHLRDEAIYEKVNRKEYTPTIYPPAAQVVFLVATRFGETLPVMKLAMLGFEALAIWAVLALLAARGLPGALVLPIAWHPLAVWEVAGSGHIDIVAIALMMLALLAAERGRQGAAGIVLGLAACAKFFPLVVAPALWRRWSWKMPVFMVLSIAALYLSYLSVGSKVFGSLGGYVGEGMMTTGAGFFLSALIREIGLTEAALPIFIVGALGLLGALAWRSVFRAQPQQPDLRGAFTLVVAFTVLMSPHHAWYFMWLIPFLCFFASPAVLYLTLSSVALYRVGWPPSVTGAAFLYVPFFILLVLENIKPSNVGEMSDDRLRV
jgi:alpha-1,6-mannosyltransferase